MVGDSTIVKSPFLKIALEDTELPKNSTMKKPLVAFWMGSKLNSLRTTWLAGSL